jgi:hypothetical protein
LPVSEKADCVINMYLVRRPYTTEVPASTNQRVRAK